MSSDTGDKDGIFDFHARLTGRPAARDRLLATMDATGISRAAVSAGGVLDLDRLSAQIVHGGHTVDSADNDGVLAACAAAPDRLVPFYFANPHVDVGRYREQAPAFRGVELSPAVHGVGFDDPRTLAVVEVAARAAHPVYVVCLGRPGSRATDLAVLAARHPEVWFVFGHAGFTGIDTNAVNEIAARENILVETSGCFTVVARVAIDRLGADRVLFGTEHPLQHPSVELAKYAALRLAAPAWRKVSWLNAHRLLGEDVA